MIRTLKSGDVVVFDERQHTVRLNGSTVYLQCGSKTIAIQRKRAEMLQRIENPPPPLLPRPPTAPLQSQPHMLSVSTTATTSTTTPVTKAAATTATADDKRERLKALLLKSCAADVDVEKLCDEVINTLADSVARGGVYLIRIESVAGKPVQFRRAGAETDEFVLAKFGKADVYADRFRQFKFTYSVAMKVDGNTTMEAALKRQIPANWKQNYFDLSTRNSTVLKRIGCEGNNGPSEWRIMRRTTYDEIKRRADAGLINSLNWQHQLQVAQPILIKEKELELDVGAAAKLVNSKMFQIY